MTDAYWGVLARRSEVNLATLLELAESGKSSIEFGLAANPRAPADLLERLATSRSEYTRANVAGIQQRRYTHYRF